MNTKKTKSSSGDTSATHPYIKHLVGMEVETSKIDRTVKPYKITIIKKIL